MLRSRLRLIAIALCLALSGLYVGAVRPLLATNNSIPAFSHVFEIVLENHEASSIIGSSSAPYINSLAQKYGLATNYYGIRHPSLPNYLALIGGDTFGVLSNCTTCFINAPNLADQIEHAGKSWKAYMESMPQPCYIGDSGSLYRQKHNPFIYFDDIRQNTARCNNIVPLTQFDTDLQNQSVPDYVWITPNMCNSMHDCSVSAGDSWLKTWVGKILASPAWQQNGVLFITFDEGSTDAGCCTLATGGKIVTLVISPLGKPSYQSSIAYDHYSLLRTIEEAWGLPLLANAGCDCSASMLDFFGSVASTPTATATPTEPSTATATPTSLPQETPTATITATIPPVNSSEIFTATFIPRADAYVSQDSPGSSYAINSQLLAVAGSAEKRSFLGFTVAELPPDAQVISAKLRLTVVNDSTSGGQVYSLSNTSWPESITWRTQPAIDGPQLAALGPVALNSVVEVDVSAVVKGNGDYSFGIVSPPGNQNTVGYASQQNAEPARWPQLILEAQAPTPSPTPTPVPTEPITPTEIITPTIPPVNSSAAFTSTFSPRADAYVSQGSPGSAYGLSSQLLAVGGSAEKRSFLGFTVAELPADVQVTSAKLRLTVVNDSTTGGQIYGLSNTSWPEAITWRSQPAIDGPQLAELGPVALNSVVEIDVSAVVKGNGEYSFAIVSPSGNQNTVGYASQQNAEPARWPQLVINALSSNAPPIDSVPAAPPAQPLAAPLPESEEPTAPPPESAPPLAPPTDSPSDHPSASPTATAAPENLTPTELPSDDANPSPTEPAPPDASATPTTEPAPPDANVTPAAEPVPPDANVTPAAEPAPQP